MPHRARVGLVVGTLCVIPPAAVARQAPAPTGFILGQVVDADTNRPVQGATVTLTAVGQPVQFGSPRTPPAMTGADGHFLFHSLGGGSYSLSAVAPGYLGSGYGQRSPLGPTQPFVLEERQRAGGVVLRLWRGSEIGGVVTDETGAPVPGLNVLITRRGVTSGRAELRSASFSVRTDDRGAYSQASLQPGEYVVAVPASMTVARFGQGGMDQPDDLALVASGAQSITRGSLLSRSGAQTGDVIVLPGGLNTLAAQLPLELQPDGRLSTYATTFHPSSTTLKEATVVKLGVAEERRDVNLQLRPVVTARVNGTLVAPDGPAAGYAVHLIPAFAVHTPIERFFEAAVAITDRSGGFTFPAVAAGSYVIQSWRMPSRNTSLIAGLPAEPSLWAEASLSVDAAPVTVVLTLRRGAGLRGRIVLEGTSAQPMPRAFQATLGAWFEPPWPLAYNAGPLGQTRISDNWEFMREGVPPGRYVPNIASNFRPPAGWYFKSATLDGRDLLQSPLVLDSADISGIVVTFTDRRTTLSGTVVDRSGRPDSDAAVFVFPADYQTWLQHGLPGAVAHTAAVTQTGSYEFRHVPPGEYLIAAASLDQLETWPEESAVRTLAVQATRVTLTSGSVTRQDLRR